MLQTFVKVLSFQIKSAQLIVNLNLHTDSALPIFDIILEYLTYLEPNLQITNTLSNLVADFMDACHILIELDNAETVIEVFFLFRSDIQCLMVVF